MKGSTIIDARGVVNGADAVVTSVTPEPQRIDKITEKDVIDPKRLAEVIDRLQQEIRELSNVALSSPFVYSIEFRDVSCTSGTAISLRHGMGRRVRYLACDGQSNNPGFTRSTTLTTDDILVLTPTATCTVSILVF